MAKTAPFLRWLALSVAAVAAGAPPATAQQGYYDRYGNFVELAPPPMWREPPPVRRRLPPVYAAPVYREADPYAAPPGWVRMPPADIPEAAGRRIYVDPDVPSDYGLQADPDAPVDGYVDDGYREAPMDAYGEEAYRDAPRDWERGQNLDRAPDGSFRRLSPDDPYFREARPDLAPPPGFGGEIAAPDRRASAAVAALDRYAGAKAAAIDRADIYERLTAIRSVNAYLVSAAAQPATAATIRAIDKLLGLAVTAETTALPGAGTEISTPKATGRGAADEAVRLIGAYAEVKARARASADEAERRRLDDEAAAVLAAGGVDLAPDERAGLDAFLGLGPDDARVAGRTPAGQGSQWQ